MPGWVQGGSIAIVLCRFGISEIGSLRDTSGAKARTDLMGVYAALEGPLFHGGVRIFVEV
jgi:hypothetical protein